MSRSFSELSDAQQDEVMDFFEHVDEHHECYDREGDYLGACVLVEYREGWESLYDPTIYWPGWYEEHDLEETPDPDFVYLPDGFKSPEMLWSIIREYDGHWIYVLADSQAYQEYHCLGGQPCDYKRLPQPLQGEMDFAPYAPPQMWRF